MGLQDRIDDGIMYGVNKLVRVYNWTTGGTKKDLANDMITSGAAMSSIGSLNNGLIFGSAMSISWLFITYFQKRVNKDIEKRELSALEKGAKDSHVEKTKVEYKKVMGPLFTLLSGSYMFLPQKKGEFIDNTKVTNYLSGTGIIFWAGGYYVMCADNLPPRKNALSRGIEKAKAYVAELGQKPSLSPSPACRIKATNNIGLEFYLNSAN